VAAEIGATPNQVVLVWLMGGELPVVPLVGASSVAQLDEPGDRTLLCRLPQSHHYVALPRGQLRSGLREVAVADPPVLIGLDTLCGMTAG
jgi:hypothetical protein